MIDPRDQMQAEHDAQLSKHSAFQAPAAMPSEEDVARVIAQNPPDRSWEDCEDSMRLVRDHTPTARAILDLFATILAEKDLHHATGERITRKDLNNAHRKGAEEGRLAAHLIDGVNSSLNACCYRDGCRALEARALAAEAALAAERERCAKVAERTGTRTIGPIIAAAIRAQIAVPGAAVEAP